MSEIKVSIERSVPSRNIEIHIFEQGDDIYEHHFFPSPEGITTLSRKEKVEDYMRSKPSLVIPSYIYDLLAKAIINDHEAKGYKSESDFKVLGKLEAKESHLSDVKEMNEKLFNLLDKTIKKPTKS